MEQAIGDLIGGKLGVIPVHGYRITDADIRVQNAESLRGIKPTRSNTENAALFADIVKESYAHVSISSEVEAAVIDASKPYADYHFMIMACRTTGEGPFIQSINDMQASELSRSLALADQMMEMYEKDAGGQLITGISINYHKNPLKLPPESGIKTWAQTLDALHIHVVGIRLNQLDAPVDTPSVDRRDAINLFDPATLLIEQMAGIPVIHDMLLQDLSLIGRDVVNLRTGLEFDIHHENLGDVQVATELQLLQERFHNLYNQLAELFIDSSQLDAVDMPELRPDRHDRINQYIEDLDKQSQNSNHTQLYQLSRSLHRWADLMVPGDDPDVLTGKKPMFMRSFADTITIMRDPDEKKYKMIMAPRILSTGNMVASLGFLREPVEHMKPVDDARRAQQQRMELQLKTLD